MESKITIGISTLITMLTMFITGWYFMDRREKKIKEDIEQMVNGKIAEHKNTCNEKLHDVLDEMKQQLTEVVTTLKLMNGKGKEKDS